MEILEHKSVMNAVKLHTRMMEAYVENHEKISAAVIHRRALHTIVRSSDIAEELFQIEGGRFKDVNVGLVLEAIKTFEDQKFEFSKVQVQAIVAVQFALDEHEGPKAKSQRLRELAKVAPHKSVLEFILLLTEQIVLDGASTIYNFEYLEKYDVLPYRDRQPANPETPPDTDPPEPPSSDNPPQYRPPSRPPKYLGDEMIGSDASGAISGGLVGAARGFVGSLITGGAATIPATAGGAAIGAIGGAASGSLKTVFDWSMGKGSYKPLLIGGGYPYPHGPDDPNGPIGSGGGGSLG